MQQAGLRGLQFSQSVLGGVARRADLGLGALSLGDVAVDQHNPTTRHRVVPYLDDPPIRPGALERALSADQPRQSAHFRLDIARPILATFRQVPSIALITAPRPD